MTNRVQELISEGLGENGYLSEELMELDKSISPIFCVDALLVPTEKSPHAILLYRDQNNLALPGYYWVVGGRVAKGQTMIDSLESKIKKETGLELKVNPDDQLFTEDGIMVKRDGKFHTCGNRMPEGILQEEIYHTPQTIYLVRTPPLNEIKHLIKPGNGNSGFKVIDKIEEDLDSYVKKAINMAWTKIGYKFD